MLQSHNAGFIDYAMLNAVPFNMCLELNTFCAYRSSMELYEKLLTTQDKKNPKEMCAANYLNKNRMTVINTLVTNSVNLWNQAYCDACYVDITSKQQNLTNSTRNFLQSLEVYNECVHNVTTNKNINNTVVCSECVGDYQTLNAFL